MARDTIQRSIIYQELVDHGCHPTADELYQVVHEKYPGISRATVYRTLNRLSEDGTITRVRMSDGADRFDHRAHDHFHVKCTRCGRVDDVNMPPIDSVAQQVAALSGYDVSGYVLVFEGICPECASSTQL